MRTALSHLALTLALACGALWACPAHAAGTVEVKFVEAEKFTDMGFGAFERERHQASLDASFQRLAKRLPNGRTLKIEVLDVDLAGEVRRGATRDIRIVRGGIDWPRIHLRYTLQDGNTSVQSGEERLADMNYLLATRRIGPRDGPLPYEQRMIERWFTDTFPTPHH